MKHKIWSLVMAAIAVALIGAMIGQQARAAAGSGSHSPVVAPGLISYQGYLTDSNGDPVADGSYDMQFELYDSSSGGSLIWAEDHAGVVVSNGYFAAMLGGGTCTAGCPLDAGDFSSDTRYVQVSADLGAGMVVFPRQRLAAAPYAMQAGMADEAGSADTAASAPWSGLTGMPAGFADGQDADALGALSCAANEIAKWNGSAWVCAPDVDTDTVGALSCAASQIAKWNGSAWVCAADNDTDTDTLGALSCAADEIAKWDGNSWECAADETGGGQGYANVITVAVSGGDYTSVAEALDSISDAAADNPYLVRVMPGVYTETDLVEVKGYVHVRGSGPLATVVTSARTGSAPNNAAATVDLLDNGRISQLTVRNTGAGIYGIALYSAQSTRAAVVDNVVAEATGAGGTGHYAAYWNDAEAVIRNSTLFAGGAVGFGTAVNAAFGSVNIAGGFPQALIEDSILMGGSASNLENCNDATGTGFGMQLSNSSPLVRYSYICGGHRGVALYTNGNPQIQSSSIKVSSTGSAFLFEITAAGSISVASSGVSYVGNKFTGAGTGLRCVHDYNLGSWAALTNGVTTATACN